ncbi:MAG TPA: DUF4340 domain-containing protein [Polyangiaceae bacterium]|nr:DUF4340 domain-containing protein [Polyangiaceae bacterium]
MAITSDQKLYIAAGVLVLLGAGLYVQKRAQKQEEATYSYTAINAALPKLDITDEQSKAIDTITIEQPAGDAGKPTKVVLKKEGDDWQLVEPIKAKGNKENVNSLLENIKDIKVNEPISPSKDAYAQYEVSDDKAVHVVAKQGDKVLADLYFGQGGSRGQMLRIAGKEGVYSAKGYSSYLYARDLKGWRDLSVTKFEDAKVKTIAIENEHGAFEFTKLGSGAGEKKDDDSAEGSKTEWSGKFRKGKAGALATIDRFDSSKVNDLVRSYKSLNALDFAQGKTAADVGLDKPKATVSIVLDDGARRVIRFGNTGSSSDRWIQVEGSSDLLTIPQYSADWITSDVDKFQKPADKKDKK